MKKEDVKVGMRVKVGNMSTEDGAYEFDNGVIEPMLQFIGKEFNVEYVNELGVYFSNSTIVEGYGFPLECLTPVEQPFSLSNTKINVQKYADENGITLKQAHEEIQTWLFEQGYSWDYTRNKEVHTDCGRFLYCYDCSGVTHDNSAEYFVKHENKEITLSRKMTVEFTPSFVEPEKPSMEYVELGGKKYIKKELEEALSKIKAVEE